MQFLEENNDKLVSTALTNPSLSLVSLRGFNGLLQWSHSIFSLQENREGLSNSWFQLPMEEALLGYQKCIISNISQPQESLFCSWHGSLSNRKIRLMNDFHRTLLRSPQIPLTFFFTFPYIICCHGNTASTKLPIKII